MIFHPPFLACDSHVHCFNQTAFPLGSQRAYTPGDARVDQLLALHKGLGIQRAVFVQPSVYGTDNRCQLAAIAQYSFGEGHLARGVAVVDAENTSKAQLLALHEGGMRGLRLNLRVSEVSDANHIQRELMATARLLTRLQDTAQWHLQIHAKFEVHAALLKHYQDIASAGTPVVLDHFAGAQADEDKRLLEAMSNYPIYVKLSAAYRLAEPDKAATLAKQYFDAAPQQVLWASDWPHTGGAGGQGRKPEEIEPFRSIDNQSALNTVCIALGEQGARQMLVHNPAHLYDF